MVATVFVVLAAGSAEATETVYQQDLVGDTTPPQPGVPIHECADAWFSAQTWGIPNTPSAQTYYTNTQLVGGVLIADAIAAIESAFVTWNTGSNACGRTPSSNFVFMRAAETTAYPSLFQTDPQPDGLNEVAFIDLGLVSGINPAAVGQARELVDTVTGKVVEFDIALDKNRVWSTSGLPGGFDIRNAVTHLAGLALGLLSTSNTSHANLTMFSKTWPGDTGKRSLGFGDTRGLESKSASRPA